MIVYRTWLLTPTTGAVEQRHAVDDERLRHRKRALRLEVALEEAAERFADGGFVANPEVVGVRHDL